MIKWIVLGTLILLIILGFIIKKLECKQNTTTLTNTIPPVDPLIYKDDFINDIDSHTVITSAKDSDDTVYPNLTKH